ncbi:WxL protein host-binding domain-containing protein [Carnobacterium gallinarum]|uniref:DUF916 and DUF3324 domain-containing protein n=1 Tax=Carnobacterium gallinarum TaxID=2749 RepID=UPI0005578045|nr:DUF916 and DUF3324 domain-containing protein [Carnobacterium gallinarum]
MKKRTYLVYLLLLPLIFFNTTYPAVAANDEGHPNQGVQYSVSKIKQAGELNPNSSFYDLKAIPGEKITIQARLYNAEETPIKIDSKILTTFTNEHGEIAYTAVPEKFDDSLLYKVSDFSTVDNDNGIVEIPAKDNKVIQATIDVPKNAKGVMLGSWYFEKSGQVKDEKSKEGININNKYSYALAIKLTVNESEKPNLNLIKVTPTLRQYQKVIETTIQNDQATVVSELSVAAKVMKKGSKEVLYENSGEGLIMAPNSNFNYPVYLENSPMKAGDYTIAVTATTNDAKWESKTWQWTEDFTITAEEAKENTKNALNDPEAPPSNWRYIGIFAILLVFVALLVYLIMKYKMRKQKESFEKRLKK